MPSFRVAIHLPLAAVMSRWTAGGTAASSESYSIDDVTQPRYTQAKQFSQPITSPGQTGFAGLHFLSNTNSSFPSVIFRLYHKNGRNVPGTSSNVAAFLPPFFLKGGAFFWWRPLLKSSWFPYRGPKISTISLLFRLQYFDFFIRRSKTADLVRNLVYIILDTDIPINR